MHVPFARRCSTYINASSIRMYAYILDVVCVPYTAFIIPTLHR